MKGACPGEVSSSKAALPPRSLLPAPQLSTSQGHKCTQLPVLRLHRPSQPPAAPPAQKPPAASRPQPLHHPGQLIALARGQTINPTGKAERAQLPLSGCTETRTRTPHTTSGLSPILPQSRRCGRAGHSSVLPPPIPAGGTARGMDPSPDPQVVPGAPGEHPGMLPTHPALPLRNGMEREEAGLRSDAWVPRTRTLSLRIINIYKICISSVSLFLSFLFLLLSEGNGHIWAKPGRNQRHSEGGTAERRKFLQFQSF